MKTLEFIKNNNSKNDIEESVIVFGLDMLKTIIIEIIVAVMLAIFAGCFWRAMIFLACNDIFGYTYAVETICRRISYPE